MQRSEIQVNTIIKQWVILNTQPPQLYSLSEVEGKIVNQEINLLLIEAMPAPSLHLSTFVVQMVQSLPLFHAH